MRTLLLLWMHRAGLRSPRWLHHLSLRIRSPSLAVHAANETRIDLLLRAFDRACPLPLSLPSH